MKAKFTPSTQKNSSCKLVDMHFENDGGGWEYIGTFPLATMLYVADLPVADYRDLSMSPDFTITYTLDVTHTLFERKNNV